MAFTPILEDKLIALKESPPIAKNVSDILILSISKVVDNKFKRKLSISFLGLIFSIVVFNSNENNFFLSTLPFGVYGICSSSLKKLGIIYKGKELDKNDFKELISIGLL